MRLFNMMGQIPVGAQSNAQSPSRNRPVGGAGGDTWDESLFGSWVGDIRPERMPNAPSPIWDDKSRWYTRDSGTLWDVVKDDFLTQPETDVAPPSGGAPVTVGGDEVGISPENNERGINALRGLLYSYLSSIQNAMMPGDNYGIR